MYDFEWFKICCCISICLLSLHLYCMVWHFVTHLVTCKILKGIIEIKFIIIITVLNGEFKSLDGEIDDTRLR